MRLPPTIPLLAGGAYFVDMFLRWAPRHGEGRVTGWETFPGTFGALAALALVLVELPPTIALWRARAQRLTALYLEVATGILAVGALVHMHWGYGPGGVRLGQYAYGSWIALALAILLLVDAFARLRRLD